MISFFETYRNNFSISCHFLQINLTNQPGYAMFCVWRPPPRSHGRLALPTMMKSSNILSTTTLAMMTPECFMKPLRCQDPRLRQMWILPRVFSTSSMCGLATVWVWATAVTLHQCATRSLMYRTNIPVECAWNPVIPVLWLSCGRWVESIGCYDFEEANLPLTKKPPGCWPPHLSPTVFNGCKMISRRVSKRKT